MFKNKILILCFSLGIVLSVSSFAKQHDDKYQKQKVIPYGLQKKVQRTGKLPHGWEKKLKKGEVLSSDILAHATLVDKKLYPKEFQDNQTKIYRIEDKVIRVINATNEILNILK